ncbi:MAG TPA: universal stress protein [Solirubrobacteraceae bacterium]|jgi:nucleotide-binding universal stress UspA family protein|nr:universal stress protein [Solirubrobacteraceae bacterium]
MFHTILCATDGSEHGDRALRYAIELARHDDAHVHVVHVIERLMGGLMAGEPLFIDEREIKAKVRAQASALAEDEDLALTVHMPTTTASRVADRLASIADRLDADVIVVGARGHSGLGALRLGGVTRRLLHIAHRPILAVPPDGAPTAGAPGGVAEAAKAA